MGSLGKREERRHDKYVCVLSPFVKADPLSSRLNADITQRRKSSDVRRQTSCLTVNQTSGERKMEICLCCKGAAVREETSQTTALQCILKHTLICIVVYKED